MREITVVIVGYGDRGTIYGDYAIKHAGQIKVVGIVEPDKHRRLAGAEKFNLNQDCCFDSFENFISKGRFADCVINATMDSLHVETTLQLLRLKYHVLLEKPVTDNTEDFIKLRDCANENGCRLIVCHVLRYAPFYVAVKKLLLNGAIGFIRHISTTEHVGIPHASASFIRGKWNNKSRCGSSYLLQKCCHDLDLIVWLLGDKLPEMVSSIGYKKYFIQQNAPKEAGLRCLLDCPIEKECPYSIAKVSKNKSFEHYIWENYPEIKTVEDKMRNLKYDNPHGTCIYKTDADIIDQQMVMVGFKDGTTAFHNLFSGAIKAGRTIHIIGDKGEIDGCLDDNRFVLRTYIPETTSYKEEVINIDINKDDVHAGGDYGIMKDFCSVLSGEPRSISCTDINDSLMGHVLVYAADCSMKERKIIYL